MSRANLIGAAFGAAAALAIPAIAFAFGAGGGFGGGVGGHAGIGAVGPSAPNVNINPYLPDQRFRELKLAGQVPAIPEKLPSGSRIVQLVVNGQTIPMALDTEMGSADLDFDPDSRYAEDLYRAILTRNVAVVGDGELRQKIIDAAGKSQPIEVQGRAFNSTAPYFVVTSVEAAK
jgi:hypothetical protein